MTTQQKIKQKEAELQELRNQLEKEQNDPKNYLKEILGNELVMKVDPDQYPNSVFYFKGETCLLEKEKSENETYLWCNYSKIWCHISEKFSLDYASMQGLIRETAIANVFIMNNYGMQTFARSKYICSGSDLTEEMIRELNIVETKLYGSPPEFCTIAYKYGSSKNGFRPGFCAPNGKQFTNSFISAIEAQGWYWGRNPLGHSAEYYSYIGNEKDWHDAESRTFHPERVLIFEIVEG